jgi:pyrroloquinoline quinone biosynthesis protein B
MWIRVLGTSGGGGFPQWNCNCPHCQAVRSGTAAARPRTQCSIAASADYRRWFLFNATPDLRAQIEANPPLQPREGVRHTPIEAVVLSDAEMDHTVGLYTLREGRRLRLYSTAWVRQTIAPILDAIGALCAIDWIPVRLDTDLPLEGRDGRPAGLVIRAFATLTTKVAFFAADRVAQPEVTVGYRITDAASGRAAVYLPALQELNDHVRASVDGAACLLVDGTCWDDDELDRLGIQGKTSLAMGHLPVGGPAGSLEQLATLPVERVIYTHLNNTNPMLIEDSWQRRAVTERGIGVAYDGLEIEI